MVKELTIRRTKIEYDLQYKNVKNINLRIKPSGAITVSVNKRVKEKVIEEFLTSKADFILKALNKFERATLAPKKQYFREDEIREVITKLCEKAYPYFREKGISFPQIKFRKMKSRWGSCHTKNGILTFNLNLIYAQIECIEYVVYHEFTHFLVPNHSAKFYQELAKVCPDWKEKRQKLKEIVLL